MTRVEFEHAFTPLNPLHRGGPKTGPITVGGVEQKKAVPIDLMTKSLQGTERPSKRDSSLGKITTTEATLRGADRGSMRVSDIMARMPVILATFTAQADKPGYEFRVPQGPPRPRAARTPRTRRASAQTPPPTSAGES